MALNELACARMQSCGSLTVCVVHVLVAASRSRAGHLPCPGEGSTGVDRPTASAVFRILTVEGVDAARVGRAIRVRMGARRAASRPISVKTCQASVRRNQTEAPVVYHVVRRRGHSPTEWHARRSPNERVQTLLGERELTIRPTRDLDDLVNRGYRFALSLTHNVTRAEDLTQDAWFAILRCGGPWSREYLFTTIRNRFIDQYRHDKRIEIEPLENRAELEAELDSQEWDDDVPFAATNGLFNEALGRLSADERAVLYLAAVEECTAQQIANLLDRPRGTVLSTIHRARGKLRAYMANDSRAKA